MSRLTQYSPFTSEPFADVFQAFLRPIRQTADEQAPRMDIDVTEAGDKYVLKADVPGIDKKDITVQIDGSTVMISANKEKRTETKEAGNVIRQERFWGQVQRTVSLASPIDESAAKAVCENGVLTLTLPKSAGSRNKTLQIE